MKDEQLSFLSSKNIKGKKDTSKHQASAVSTKILNAFQVLELPFLGCDFDTVYPAVAALLPNDEVSFQAFPLDVAITCEIICAAICHQMNWDYLRRAIYLKTIESIDWVSSRNLAFIDEESVNRLFIEYPKKERIRKEERTSILHEIGTWLDNYSSAKSIFLSPDNKLLDIQTIKNHFDACDVFVNDPEGKKMQLLFQKLSVFSELQGMKQYYKPAIDYHLIRCYTRRGLIMAKSKLGVSYLSSENVERKENTVAAIRQLCSELMISICQFTSLDILTVNQIEWNIGRSVCLQNHPDCFLKGKESKWLKPTFSKCPFFDTCTARLHNKKFLSINEPTYKGSSY